MSSTTSSPSPSSSSPTSDTSFLHSHPVYPCVLPTPVTYTLYIAVVMDAGILYKLVKLPFYESNAISQELICLLHDSLHLQSYSSSSVPDSDQALLHITRDLICHTLNILHLHSFHTYITRLPAEMLFPVFSPLYQSMSLLDKERYKEIVTLEPVEPVTEVTLTPIPIPPPSSVSTVSPSTSLTTSLASCISSHPSSPPIPLASRISSRPPSPTPTLIPETGFSQENALLHRTYIFSMDGYGTLNCLHSHSGPTQPLPEATCHS